MNLNITGLNLDKKHNNSSDSRVTPQTVKLRDNDFETAKCKFCVYFSNGNCKVLDIQVSSDQVCDAYQGGTRFRKFKVPTGKEAAFINGMVKLQPYQHKIIKGVNSPVGWLIIIEDTMKPKPHRFSIPISFSIEHTSREHAWTQEEVDELIKRG